jgi:mannosyltransferase
VARAAAVRPELPALAALIVLGAGLRFATLGDRSFWVDEAFTVTMVNRSFGGMLHVWRLHEANPPLYPVLAWLWAKAFGIGEVALRSLPAALGTVTIPVAYAVTTRLATPRAGLVAALLAAVSALDVWFSQDARPYALVVLVAGLSFWAFLRAREEPSRRSLGIWAAASALAVLSHYFAAYLVAAEGLWLLAVHPSRRRPTLAAAAVPTVIFAALMPVALTQNSVNQGAPFLGLTSKFSRIVQVPAQYLVGFQPPAQVAVSLAAFLAVPVVAWLLVARSAESERRGALVAATVGAAALLGPLVAALLPGLDYAYTRYTVSAFVPLLAAVAIGLGARRAGLLGAGALVWLVGISLAIDVITADHSKFDHEDWRAAAHALPPANGDRAIVVSPGTGAAVLPLYLHRAARSRATRFTVREVDLIGLPPPIRRTGKPSRPPRPPSPPPPAGFALVQRRDAPTFTLLRYLTSRPAPVSREELEALALSRSRPSAVVIARP